MKRAKIIAQLESEMVAVSAAIADGKSDYIDIADPAFYDGYWVGRLFGLQQSLTLLKGKELNHE